MRTGIDFAIVQESVCVGTGVVDYCKGLHQLSSMDFVPSLKVKTKKIFQYYLGLQVSTGFSRVT